MLTADENWAIRCLLKDNDAPNLVSKFSIQASGNRLNARICNRFQNQGSSIRVHYRLYYL
jgi:hypothetical protein